MTTQLATILESPLSGLGSACLGLVEKMGKIRGQFGMRSVWEAAFAPEVERLINLLEREREEVRAWEAEPGEQTSNRLFLLDDIETLWNELHGWRYDIETWPTSSI